MRYRSLRSYIRFIRPPGLWVRFALAVLFLCALASPIYSDQVTINFDDLADGTAITAQYAGLVFSNLTVATAGVSLNEFEFPPQSGMNVALSSGAPITIVFSIPVISFDAFFTYSVPLTLEAFNTSNTLVASATSLFASNEGLSGVPGSSPNERIQVSSSGGISSVEILSAPSGSFAMDDVTYATSTTSIPEPSSLILAFAGCSVLIAFRKRSFVAPAL